MIDTFVTLELCKTIVCSIGIRKEERGKEKKKVKQTKQR